MDTNLVAVITVLPHNDPHKLYVGTDDLPIDQMEFLGETPPFDLLTAEVAAKLDDLVRAHGYITTGAWANEVEYWEATVVPR